jgi:hypothetical protein
MYITQIAFGQKLKDFLDQGGDLKKLRSTISDWWPAVCKEESPELEDVIGYLYCVQAEDLPPRKELQKLAEDMILGKDLHHVARQLFATQVLKKLKAVESTAELAKWVSWVYGDYIHLFSSDQDEPLKEVICLFEEIFDGDNYPFDYDIPVEKLRGMCHSLLAGEDPGDEWWQIPEEVKAKMVRVLGGFSVK